MLATINKMKMIINAATTKKPAMLERIPMVLFPFCVITLKLRSGNFKRRFSRHIVSALNWRELLSASTI